MKKGGTGIQGNEFMTIICRDDMAPGYKVVQTAHALADFAVKHENEFKQWQMGSNYLCCLETSENRLGILIERMEDLKIKHEVFREPDIGNQITAVAVEAISREQHKTLFKKFKLTLS